MDLNEALPGFVAEAGDLLREMESALLECSGGTTDAEKINLIFRSAHTIKGSAGLFGLDPIVSFVHVVETALDQVRLGHVPMTEELVTLLLRCKDHIEALLEPVGTGGVPDVSLEGRGDGLLTALRQIAEVSTPGAGSATGNDFSMMACVRVKIAVVAPMPMARVSNAVNVNAGAWRSCRRA